MLGASPPERRGVLIVNERMARLDEGRCAMLTIKDVMTSGASSSPDGKHWEPALPYMRGMLHWRDAWAVFRGRAVAVRQTTKDDLAPTKGATR